MAITIDVYNQATAYIANNGLSNITPKVMLRSSTPFDASHTDLTNLAGSEVSGFGWDVGGEPLANFVATVFNTDDAKFDADDISVTLSGGSLTGVTQYVIYHDDGADGVLLYHVDFGETKQADDGSPFEVIFDGTNGIDVITRN